MRCRISIIPVSVLVWIGIASALPEDSESGCTSAACIWARLRERGLVRDPAASAAVATRRAEEGGYAGGAGEPRQYYAYYERPAYRQPSANYQHSPVAVAGKKVVWN